MELEKIYLKDTDCEKIYLDSKKQKWPYYTEKQMLEQYPDGDFKVLGDFSIKYAHDLKITKKLLTLDGQEAYVKAYGGNAPRGYYLIGYIPLQQSDAFVRVLGKKKGKWLALLALLLLLCSIFLGGLWLGNSKRPVDTPVKIASGELRNDDPTNIVIPGIKTLGIRENKLRIQQPLLNVEGNAYNLTYTIALEKTGEVIYTSPSIEPGYGVKQFNLNRTFKKGSYPVTITVDSSAQKENKKKDKNKQVAYNAGRLHATLVVK